MDHLTALQDRRVLASNVDQPLPGSAPTRRTRVWPLLLTAFVAVGAIGAVGTTSLLRPQPTPAPRVTVAASDQPDPGGSTIVSDCFGIDTTRCLTANPSLHPALSQLATTAEGPSLMHSAATAGVAVRVGTLADGVYADFDPKARAVTIDTSLTKMSARGQAAIIAHELRAVATWSGPAGIVPSTGLTCIQEQTSAYATELAVWKELRGGGPPKDSLETEEDDLVHQMDSR
ncbi:MAG: hypothetical protein JOZ65_12435, partial [Chloroflexi bacterium]|nr:hypothetical protein [Chloroflexota bacterium]